MQMINNAIAIELILDILHIMTYKFINKNKINQIIYEYLKQITKL